MAIFALQSHKIKVFVNQTKSRPSEMSDTSKSSSSVSLASESASVRACSPSNMSSVKQLTLVCGLVFLLLSETEMKEFWQVVTLDGLEECCYACCFADLKKFHSLIDRLG